jgi:hypothetical protein
MALSTLKEFRTAAKTWNAKILGIARTDKPTPNQTFETRDATIVFPAPPMMICGDSDKDRRSYETVIKRALKEHCGFAGSDISQIEWDRGYEGAPETITIWIYLNFRIEGK